MKRNFPKKKKKQVNKEDFQDLFKKDISDLELKAKMKQFWKDTMHSVMTSPIGDKAPDKVKNCFNHMGGCDCIEYRYHTQIHTLYSFAFDLIDILSALADLKIQAKDDVDSVKGLLNEYPLCTDNILALHHMLKQSGVLAKHKELAKIFE